MARFILMATSSAKVGREDEYNTWYDTIHVKDLLAIPGVASARRFMASPVSPHSPPSDFMTIFELEADDPADVLKELHSRGASGQMRRTDALDPASAQLWIWADYALGGAGNSI